MIMMREQASIHRIICIINEEKMPQLYISHKSEEIYKHEDRYTYRFKYTNMKDIHIGQGIISVKT